MFVKEQPDPEDPRDANPDYVSVKAVRKHLGKIQQLLLNCLLAGRQRCVATSRTVESARTRNTVSVDLPAKLTLAQDEKGTAVNPPGLARPTAPP